MRAPTASVAFTLCLWAIPGPGRADVPGAGKDVGEANYLPPVEYPSEARVLRALGPGKWPRHNVRIGYLVLEHRPGPIRFYRLLGRKRLVHNRIKCIVDSDRGREVVYFDMDYLIPPR